MKKTEKRIKIYLTCKTKDCNWDGELDDYEKHLLDNWKTHEDVKEWISQRN